MELSSINTISAPEERIADTARSTISALSIDTAVEPQPRRRSSAFFEVGLGGDDTIIDEKMRNERPKLQVRFRSHVSIVEPNYFEPESPSSHATTSSASPYLRTFPPKLGAQLFLLVIILGMMVPGFDFISLPWTAPLGVKAGAVIPRQEVTQTLPRRQQSSADVCKRWSGQSALVNGTLYYYGGRASTSPDQISNTWNNNFLSLDLTKSWQISSPSLSALPSPSGPPAVALGYLWSSTDQLFLYGGQFSDSPAESPVPFSMWSYDIKSKAWNEHETPQFANNGGAVQRAAEGAGLSVPNLGRGYYFGGHLDGYTTDGWSQSIPRVYLESLVEYTMPGFSNPSLQSASPAGADGAFRNITADSAGFPERADGVLVYVPGYGKSGIILGLAGGTNQSFTQMNVIDVYDIDESKWYKQATSGKTPEIRVNPCAVAVSAADGSSTQVYMYGGQNLIPAGSQTQYDDMWILTIPSFTWISVDTSNQAVPPARAGHTCNVWNGQMVVVGGYVGQDLSCDSPGIYVFNTSSLSWQNDYTALKDDDNLNRQSSQNTDPNALQGSYGYRVPPSVQDVIGGNAIGAATVTQPAQTATQGPLATGKPVTYTTTASDGSITTQTSVPGSGSTNTSSTGGSSGVNVGAVVAGVIAGVLFLLALYLGFCAWVYRKQLKMYKRHVAMSHGQMVQSDRLFVPFGTTAFGKLSDHNRSGSSNGERLSSDNRSGNSGHATTGSGGRR